MNGLATVENFEAYAGRTTNALSQLVHVYCGAFHYPFERALLFEQMIRGELRAGHIYLVRLVNERLTGFVSYRFDTNHGDILVELNHIGNVISHDTAGGGRQLIDAMERDIHHRLSSRAGSKLQCVFLRTHLANRAAQNLYHRCGFLPVALLPSHFHDGTSELVYQKLYNSSPGAQAELVRWSELVTRQIERFYADAETQHELLTTA